MIVVYDIDFLYYPSTIAQVKKLGLKNRIT